MRGLKFDRITNNTTAVNVAPHVGAWIEIPRSAILCQISPVAPHVGAWIEIPITIRYTNIHTVAPHVGAWIEISVVEKRPIDEYVAPHVGAWIEIKTMLESGESFASHPTWVRGLKLLLLNAIVAQARSHPTWVRGLKCVGDPSDAHGGRRTPRGCVD